MLRHCGQYTTRGRAAGAWFLLEWLPSLLARSFDEAVTRAVNLNGDADSFGSITGLNALAHRGCQRPDNPVRANCWCLLWVLRDQPAISRLALQADELLAECRHLGFL